MEIFDFIDGKIACYISAILIILAAVCSLFLTEFVPITNTVSVTNNCFKFTNSEFFIFVNDMVYLIWRPMLIDRFLCNPDFHRNNGNGSKEKYVVVKIIAFIKIRQMIIYSFI